MLSLLSGSHLSIQLRGKAVSERRPAQQATKRVELQTLLICLVLHLSATSSGAFKDIAGTSGP